MYSCDCDVYLMVIPAVDDAYWSWHEEPSDDGQCRQSFIDFGGTLVQTDDVFNLRSQSGIGLRSLTDESRRVILSNPLLVANAVAVGATWAPAISEAASTPDRPATLTREMIVQADRFADRLISESEPELAMQLRALRAAVDPGELVGLTPHAALARVDAAARSTKVLEAGPASLQSGQRGLSAVGRSVVIPAAARVAGAAGTRWRSDVMVVNPGTVDAAYEVALLVRRQANSDPVTTTRFLAPGEGEFLGDVLDGVFSTDGAAALRIAARSGAVAVTSRTYNSLGAGNALGLPEGASFGQFIPALAADDAIPSGDAGDLIQLSHDPSLAAVFRTNLILVNASDAATAVEVDLRLDDGSLLGTVSTDLRPWEYDQFDRVFEQVTSSAVAGGYATVRPTTPGGRVLAMASVVDNVTGDPVAIPASRRSVVGETSLNETLTIPAAARVSGAAGTNWRTDLAIANTAFPPVFTRVDLLRRGETNIQPVSETVVTMPGESNRYDDVLQSLFATDGAAALRLSGSGIVAPSRTYNLIGADDPLGLPAGATFGQYLAPVPWTQGVLVGERALLPHLSHDPSLRTGSRTNLVLVNNATRDSDLTVELFRSDGTSLGGFTTTLGGWEY